MDIRSFFTARMHFLRTHIRLWHVILTFFGVGILLFYFLILRGLPSPTNLGSYDIPLSTKIYDRNGTLLFDIFVEQNRSPVALSQIPLTVRQATIAVEDKDFYKHQGVNPIGGIVRAMFATLTGKQLQGGSTITQQLVKSALLTSERTITRKVKEIVLAYWVELLYSKDKILELYLNQVPYGGTAWGIETAAEKYFNKHVKDLTLAESAFLAGLPQAPTLYSPFGGHTDRAIARQKEVLRRMVEDKYITKAQADAAVLEQLHFATPSNIKAAHFVMHVKDQLVELYGERMVERGGLRVITTLDLPLQEYAELVVASEVAKLKTTDVSNGAALITKPATGEVLAMVGSVDYFASPSGSYNVVTGLRQPGSSIKPINYAVGIERKLVTPATMFIDEPTCFGIVNQSAYCPKNYDFKFHGPVQLRFALGNSFNIPAVKMLKINGLVDFIASASAFGINTFTNPDNYGLSLTLGGGEVHMTDMAEAFGVFANGGVRKDLVSIKKVMDKNGTILSEFKDPNLELAIPSQLLLTGTRVVSPETAFLISHILLDNNARQDSFGSGSQLVIPNRAVSVKTGTTDDYRDNWTIGYTPTTLVATWVGNNDNSPMNGRLVSGVTGAAPIWNKLMRKMLEKQPDIWPKQPDGIVGAQICTMTGLLPPNDGDDKGCGTRFEYFIKGTVPTEREKIRQPVIVDKNTKNIALPNQTENIEVQDQDLIRDSLSVYCLTCNHQDEKPYFIR